MSSRPSTSSPRESIEQHFSLLEKADLADEPVEDNDGGGNLTQLAAAGSTLWALQLVWSTIFARGTSYLTYIGIPMSVSAFLWISGPICGMIVQPLMGALSDSYEPKGSRTGRNKRKPFILGGAIATATSMIALAWIPNIVVFLEKFLNLGQEYETLLLILNATIWVWALSISVQPLQGGIRTLLHEICSKEAQARFAASQGVLVAFGTVSGYFLASVQFGNRPGAWSAIWQFQNLTLVVSMILLLCSAITMVCPFRSPRKKIDGAASSSQYSASLKHAVKRNVNCLRLLPRSIQLTLQVQFFSWLGWFPALYYQTGYLASLYKVGRAYGLSQPTNEAEHAAADSVPHTVVMFATAVIMAATSHWASTSSKRSTFGGKIGSLTTLVVIWAGGHILFALAMVVSLFAVTETQGVWIFALVGIPRALSTWIPYALIGRKVTESHDAGTLTSLHNAALSAPQILAAGLCGFAFMVARYLDVASDDQFRWAMAVAGAAGVGASWRSWHLLREVRTSD
ncbi:Sucrose transport protein SUT2 [Cercospora beticola]|uniref:Sucrose transport protein SUT2 n=1 Tax=Cercospora beticola TaxID=122368 RepID=A0A2G5HN46_CERBT|nr:Sucrose transport protein SUT2 [Cercospora beticola]PIA93981.1 Sucrose transport protein SUT2 [Cercospora beticola]WPB01298.1 hypothetical protein RHO25_005922 [Cercospora beticola]CAK1363932.1 unnamed protein product [Cercospora beticola]